jgi:4a-hydroxytetrahydrobiopterin dehydratase
MRMKPFSRKRKTITHAAARNAALANQFATPGLGSLMAGRWIAGLGQLILSVVGCGMMLIFFFKVMGHYYGLMFDNGQAHSININFRMLKGGAILFLISWVWALATSFSLFREVAKGSVKSLENFAAPPMLKLDAAQIIPALAKVSDWKLTGDAIARTFQFKDFAAAIKFVDAVADCAEKSWHHPDIDIRWNKVTLALTTHDAGGLTEKDFALAKKFDELSLR